MGLIMEPFTGFKAHNSIDLSEVTPGLHLNSKQNEDHMERNAVSLKH